MRKGDSLEVVLINFIQYFKFALIDFFGEMYYKSNYQ